MGLRSRSPRWAIAAKFKAKQAESQIIGIDLQVGRTGVITPVAKIKEVDLSGVMISSATFIIKMKLIEKILELMILY